MDEYIDSNSYSSGYAIESASADNFGIPSNTFGKVPEEFYGALGRVVALGALVEMQFGAGFARLSGQSQQKYAGWSISQLDKELGKFVNNCQTEGQTVGDNLLRLRNRTVVAMDDRNDLVHSLWPSPTMEQAYGWRYKRRSDKSIETGSKVTPLSIDDLQQHFQHLIVELVGIANAWRDALP